MSIRSPGSSVSHSSTADHVDLSVCIPTLNRRQHLLETLAVVCDQMPPNAELVVSDNGSTDGTAEVVRAFGASRPAVRLRLVTHDGNVGFDRNVLDVVAAAAGRYCWLLGDDDLPRPGAVARIMAELSADPDLVHLLLNHARLDIRTGVISKPRMIGLPADYGPVTANDFFFRKCPPPSYFKRLGTNLITVSANVVDRGKWLSHARSAEQFIGTNMIHVFIITAMLADGGLTRFIATPQYDYACNNHRPWGNDIWLDYKTHVYGWLQDLGYELSQLQDLATEEIAHRSWREVARGFLRKIVST